MFGCKRIIIRKNWSIQRVIQQYLFYAVSKYIVLKVSEITGTMLIQYLSSPRTTPSWCGVGANTSWSKRTRCMESHQRDRVQVPVSSNKGSESGRMKTKLGNIRMKILIIAVIVMKYYRDQQLIFCFFSANSFLCKNRTDATPTYGHILAIFRRFRGRKKNTSMVIPISKNTDCFKKHGFWKWCKSVCSPEMVDKYVL